MAAHSDRPRGAAGVILEPLDRRFEADQLTYDHVVVRLDRRLGVAEITVHGPATAPPRDPAEVRSAGAACWPLALARQLDDAILHLRTNEPELGTWVLRSRGASAWVAAADDLLIRHRDDWLIREISLYLGRVLKRLDVTSRSLIALIEPGSCFAGTLLELALAADRSFMMDGPWGGDAPPTVRLTEMNFGPLAMCNGLSRLASRFLDAPEQVERTKAAIGKDLDAAVTDRLGLVTFIPDGIDWDPEVRIAIEERASYSPDALTGMEANLRFAGPETMESKIFARLSALQNWIFQRPNAVGERGALALYGTGQKPLFKRNRV